MRKAIVVWVVALTASSSSASAFAAIEQFNGTCPGGVEVHADEGGPVYINGKETRLKRFSDDYYEASDSNGLTLSINRTPDGGTQLSYTGPGNRNGVCTVGAPSRGDREARPGPSARSFRDTDAASIVTCESTDQKQHECDMDTRGTVVVSRQISHTRCVQGENWDVNRHSIWVKDGCRAEFRNVSRSDDDSSRWRSEGSRGGRVDLLQACDDRARADGSEVTRVAVNQDLMELIVDYPDGRYLCMVHMDGNVQSLTRLRRQK